MLMEKQQQKRKLAMKFILCDDNPVFLNELHRQIQQIAAQRDLICQCSLFQSPKDLLDADLSAVTALFLDIDMPTINGIEVAKLLRKKYSDVLIIFVTGFVQYARDGYYVDAFRYLLKDSLADELPTCLKDIQEKLYESQESILIQTLEYTTQVHLREILYFEGTSRRHVILHTFSMDSECLGMLAEYESQLLDQGFLRIQRSYLVNMRHIEWISRYQVCLSNGLKLKASERNYPNIIKQYLQWRGKRL